MSTGPGEPDAVDRGDPPLLVTGYDVGTSAVTIDYEPACEATDHAAYSGPLDQVALLAWDRSACNLGISGTASFDPGPASRYFVLLG